MKFHNIQVRAAIYVPSPRVYFDGTKRPMSRRRRIAIAVMTLLLGLCALVLAVEWSRW